MKHFYVGLSFCSLLLLQGCFDNSDSTTNKPDGTKSSVQLQQEKADESK
ncbi:MULTISPECIES: hypothetical protein [Pseudomonas]|nr:hypothetical protein [Pseudomonas fluorescens]